MPITYERARFFAAVREVVFAGTMTAAQVGGCEAILTEWETSQPNGDARQLAYALATTKWETASKMQPVHEYGSAAYFTRMYDPQGTRPQVARALGNTEPGDGDRFAGRGLCQTTGRRNYAWASTVVGRDCVADPDLLLQPEWACKVLFAGMIGGHYTGRKLADYFHGDVADWTGARRIINGTDHAADVAALGQRFYAALRDAATSAPAVVAPAVAPAKPIPSAPVSSSANGSRPASRDPVAMARPSLFARLAFFFGRH